MGKVVRVTPEILKSTSEKLNEHSENYKAIYQQLLQEASTMGTAWDGEDNLAFVNQINGCLDDLQAMANKLKVASEAMFKQHANYVNRQSENIAQAQKLTN